MKRECEHYQTSRGEKVFVVDQKSGMKPKKGVRKMKREK